MKSREELFGFLDSLDPADLPLVEGVRALLLRADERGWADRGLRLASVGDQHGELAAGEGEPEGTPIVGEAGIPDLEEGVLERLEAAGIVRREPPGEAWARVGFDADLWASLVLSPEASRDGAAQRLDGVARVLQRKTADTVRAPAAALTNGSRLWARDLTKVYRKRTVVNEVDISVRQGEIVGLLGPNGAGKTTTFYMMVGLIPPNRGEVYLDEVELTETPMYRRARMGVGYLAQEPSIFRKLTVEDNVLAILETLDLKKKEKNERLEELLAELSIAHLRKSKAYSLSGGERRRLEITRALVQRPKFMLLDEPFAGIDPIAVNDIQQIVGGLKHRGIGVIISDHNVEQTLEIVDRAYIMYEGRIRVSGTVSELVWNDEVAEIYLGPILTRRMRDRFSRPNGNR